MSTERHAQKSRTRAALLRAARHLLSEKAALTIPAAAAAAGVSRATAYRYFSDPAVLAAEAGLDVSTKPYAEIVEGCETAAERVQAVALFFFDQTLAHEAEFRGFLSRWLETWGQAEAPTRGGRRVEMFRAALADRRGQIGDAACDRLVRELSVATGIEAMIALIDVAQADEATARATIAHMADVLVAAALDASDRGADPRSAPSRAGEAGGRP